MRPKHSDKDDVLEKFLCYRNAVLLILPIYRQILFTSVENLFRAGRDKSEHPGSISERGTRKRKISSKLRSFRIMKIECNYSGNKFELNKSKINMFILTFDYSTILSFYV